MKRFTCQSLKVAMLERGNTADCLSDDWQIVCCNVIPFVEDSILEREFLFSQFVNVTRARACVGCLYP